MSYLVDFDIKLDRNKAVFTSEKNAIEFAEAIAKMGGHAIVYPFNPYSKDKKAFGYSY